MHGDRSTMVKPLGTALGPSNLLAMHPDLACASAPLWLDLRKVAVSDPV